jgi:hypothetical protein
VNADEAESSLLLSSGVGSLIAFIVICCFVLIHEVLFIFAPIVSQCSALGGKKEE